MISLYTFGLTTLLGFWFVSHFREWKTTFPQSSHSLISTQSSEMQICHQIPPRSAGCGKKVPWHSGWEPRGSPLEEGNEMFWVSSLQFQQGLDNPKTQKNLRKDNSTHCCSLHSTFPWQELPRRLPALRWAPVRGDGFVQPPSTRGKRGGSTGCRARLNPRECSEHRYRNNRALFSSGPWMNDYWSLSQSVGNVIREHWVPLLSFPQHFFLLLIILCF